MTNLDWLPHTQASALLLESLVQPIMSRTVRVSMPTWSLQSGQLMVIMLVAISPGCGALLGIALVHTPAKSWVTNRALHLFSCHPWLGCGASAECLNFGRCCPFAV